MRHNPSKPYPILLVEDDRTTADLITACFTGRGIETLHCKSVNDVMNTIRDQVDLGAALVDLGLPDGDGLDAIRKVRRIYPELPFFVLTAESSLENGVMAMKAGADDCLFKPADPIGIVDALLSVMERRGGNSAKRESHALRQQLTRWKSPGMRKAVEIAISAATNFCPVLITGPKASGKKWIAGLIHQESRREIQTMVHLDAAAMSARKLESKLFGDAAGGVTKDADMPRGILATRAGVTLHISNIDCLSMTIQCRLSAWLADSCRAGTEARCRLICSSSADLDKLVRTGRFRNDLRYQVGVYRVEVPALSQRIEDLADLCTLTLKRICEPGKIRRPRITAKAMDVLAGHAWSGNMAELRAVLEHATAHAANGRIEAANLPPFQFDENSANMDDLLTESPGLKELSKASLAAALIACNGNRKKAAARLNISLRTVYNMLQRYGDEEPFCSMRVRVGKTGAADWRDF